MLSDLEITKLCAEAMGFRLQCTAENFSASARRWMIAGTEIEYDPLHDDAQAMALMKKFHLPIGWTDSQWAVFDRDDRRFTLDADLNRAIVKCVAKMQQAKCTP